VGRLNGRVGRLENGSPQACPECGGGGAGGGAAGNNDTYELVWVDEAEEEYDGPEETVYCETCGEPTEIVVTWEDLPNEKEERRF
jgi:hypothetical protein